MLSRSTELLSVSLQESVPNETSRSGKARLRSSFAQGLVLPDLTSSAPGVPEGSLYEECRKCPVHGGEFDARTGEAIALPAMEPLAVHDVRIDGEEIYVRLRST